MFLLVFVAVETVESQKSDNSDESYVIPYEISKTNEFAKEY